MFQHETAWRKLFHFHRAPRPPAPSRKACDGNVAVLRRSRAPLLSQPPPFVGDADAALSAGGSRPHGSPFGTPLDRRCATLSTTQRAPVPAFARRPSVGAYFDYVARCCHCATSSDENEFCGVFPIPTPLGALEYIVNRCVSIN